MISAHRSLTAIQSQGKRGGCAFHCILAAALLFSHSASIAQSGEPTQTIALQGGWNAVFLEVQPAETDPDELFGETPISRVASWFPSESTVEYITDPGEAPWKKEGWGIWYAPGRPDAFLQSLFSIQANRSYLIYSESDYTWEVRGSRRFLPHKWKANSFNLVGFGLDPQSPPTFEKFFAGSRAHRDMKIYRLVDGHWKKVSSPLGAAMRAGEAFWVYCDGKSDFQGPLRVSLPMVARQGLLFGPASGKARVGLRNDGRDPLDLLFETEGGLPLRLLIRSLQESEGTIQDVSALLSESESLTNLEPGEQFAATLQVGQEEMSKSVQTGLLTITSSIGTRHYIPMAASRPGLSR